MILGRTAVILGCLALLVGKSASADTAAANAARQQVKLPRAKGETVVDVHAGATVVVNDQAFDPAQAKFSADDDDLVIELPGKRTLILGGFFVQGERPASLAVNERPPAAAHDLAREGFGRLTTPPEPVVGFLGPGLPVLADRAAYVYVLFPRPDQRHTALLQALLSADAQSRSPVPHPLFGVPARDGEAVQRTIDRHRPPVEARPKPEAWLQAAQLLTQDVRYDYAKARALLRGVCASSDTPRPALCERVLQGPYLLSVTAPLGDDGAVPPEFVLFDLSDVDPARFDHWVGALAAHELAPDLPASERLRSLRAAPEPLLADMPGQEPSATWRQDAVFVAQGGPP